MKKIVFGIFITFLVFLSTENLFAQVNEQKFNLAQSYEKGGDLESAVRLYIELYQDSPQKKYFDGIVRIYKQQNRFSELKPFVDTQIKKDKYSELLILSGELNWRLGKTDDANSNWKEAISNYGNVASTYVSLASTLNTLMLFDKSIEILKEGKSKYPEELVFADGLARLYILTKNYNDGIKEVFYILDKNKDVQAAQGKLYVLMSDSLANIHIDETFQKELKRSDDIYLLSLYGWYLRTTKNFTKALDVVMKLDKITNSRGIEIYRFGEESRRDGDYDVALKAFKEIIDMGKNSPQFNSALFSYTKTMEEKLQTNSNFSPSDTKQIIQKYREIIDSYPKTQYSEQSKLRIAYLQSNILKDQNAAIKELESVITTKYNSLYVVQALSSLSETYLKINEIEKCQIYIKQILDTYGKQTINPEITVLLDKAKFTKAEILYFQGKMDSALAEFQQLSQSTATDIANDAINKVVLIEQNKDFVKALGTFAKAELAEEQDKINDAINLYKEVIEIGKGEQIGEKAVIKYAALNIQQNSFELAKSSLTQYLNDVMYPIYGDNALFLLGNIAEKQMNKEAALKNYTDLLAKYPNSIYLIDSRKRILALRKTMTN